VLSRLTPNLSFANVTSALALFVALGGTAWALEANTVRSRHIVEDTVRSVDLQDGNGVTGVDVVADSLTSTEIAGDGVGAEEIGPDAVGYSELSAGGSGDFRLYLPERAWEATEVRGVALAAGTGFTILAVSLK
jgi:hypothetical protein